jgi:hypothetical protein
MLLPAIKNKRRNKKGLSIVIGYVLLMAVSISMSILVYQFLKTYVPKDIATCPEGTSLFIKEATCEVKTSTLTNLTLTFKNNGRFGIDGYFIHGSTDANALATIDLSSKFIGSPTERTEKISGNSISFSSNKNSLSPEDSSNVQTHSFNVSTIVGGLKKVEIIPIRQQVADNFKTPVSCSDAKVETKVYC